jgi:hypothetical protein
VRNAQQKEGQMMEVVPLALEYAALVSLINYSCSKSKITLIEKLGSKIYTFLMIFTVVEVLGNVHYHPKRNWGIVDITIQEFSLSSKKIFMPKALK